MKVRQAGRIVSVAVIVAVGVNGDGRRDALSTAPSCTAPTRWSASTARSSAAPRSPGSGFARPRAGSGIFPNEAAITRLVDAILLEQNDEWAVQRARYITLESIAPLSEDPIVSLPNVAA